MLTRHSFDEELHELYLEMIKMGTYVEASIDNSIMALKKQNVEMAFEVFKNDDLIDELEQKIERKCLNLIARQSPLAKDLRTITTALKIITDMERIGDHSADIAEVTIRLANEKYIKPLIHIPQMAEMAKQMVKRSIDAYVRQDAELARQVCSSDDEVDNMFFRIVLELINIMKNDSNTIDQCINFMFITKYLERMADHATNIGEWVVYNVTGEHERLAKQMHRDDRKNNPFIT